MRLISCVDSADSPSASGRRDRNYFKVATVPKLVSPPKRPLHPRLKSWIDNVIVPLLVREYIAAEKKCGESLNVVTPMVDCSKIEDSPEGGQ